MLMRCLKSGNQYTFSRYFLYLLYLGQYYDQETGLHYNYYRYYDPSTGRYITSDPITCWRAEYLYQNPVLYTDPTGEFGLIGAGIRAGLDLALQMKIEKKSLKCVDWAQVGLSGAVGGAALVGTFKLSKGSMKAQNAVR